MSDDTTYRVSDGVLLCPFADVAVAVDLIGERTHVLGRAAAWLLMQDSPVDVATLVASSPDDEREELTESILDALDTLRTPGLVDRDAVYAFPEPPGDSAAPVPGAHTGRTHAIIDRRVAFRSDDPELLGRVDTFLGGGVDESPSRFFDIVEDGGGIVLYAADRWEFANEERLLHTVPVVCNDDGARTHGVAVIHAGTVRTPHGRIVALVGPANAGKSTLTGALVAAGCDYLGDESFGVDREGTVYGYPKPLTLSQPSRRVLGLPESPRAHTPLEEVRDDARRVVTAPSIDKILLVRFDPHHVGPPNECRLEPVPALQAVLANVLNLARGGEAGLEALCNLVESTPIASLVYGDCADAVPIVMGA